MSESCVLCKTRDGGVAVPKLYEDDLVFAIDVPPDTGRLLVHGGASWRGRIK